MKLSRVLALVAALGLTVATVAEDMVVVNFDDMELVDCAQFGVTFSDNCAIYTVENPCSVFDDPNCPVASGDSALCVGDFGGVTGTIWFDAPHNFVAVVALSGNGADNLSPGTVMRGYDCNGNMIGEAFADSDLQFDFVGFAALGVMRVELFSPEEHNEGWDDLCFVPSPCPMDIIADGMIGIPDLIYVLQHWGTDDPASDVNDDQVTDIADLMKVIRYWGVCDQYPEP